MKPDGRDWRRFKEAEDERQHEIEEGVKRLFTRWMIRICQTSTVAILVSAGSVGYWIASHSSKVMKALDVLFGDGK